MIINIIIPCCSLHRKYLDMSLQSIYDQTLQPDRIIVIINEYFRYKEEYDNIIAKHPKCEFIKEEGWHVAGKNRQIGTHLVKEGLILYHDADDMMYPNKIEIVKYMFKKYNCSLLVHLVDSNYDYRPIAKINKIRVYDTKFVNEILEKNTNNFSPIPNIPTEYCHLGRDIENRNERWGLHFGNRNNKNNCSKICHGHVSVNSDVFKNISEPLWILKPSGQDVFFVNEVTRVYKNSIIIDYPLTVTIGADHIRRIGDNIVHKKSKSILKYTPSNGIAKLNVKIFDKQFGPQKSKSKMDIPKFLEWNFIDKDTDISDNDIVVYTDQTLQLTSKHNVSKKIAWILEPPSIHKYPYKYVQDNIDQFDYVFGSVIDALPKSDKTVYIPNVMSWISPNERQIYEKTKLVSLIFSNKTKTENHQFRHKIIDMIKNNNLSIDMYGDIVNKKVENKSDALKDYMFHIVVENCNNKGYYSEKIIDCFVTGTVPIFYGTTNIGDYFDINGIIRFTTIDELHNISKSVNSDTYKKMKDSIYANFCTAMNNTVPEDIIANYLKSKLNMTTHLEPAQEPI